MMKGFRELRVWQQGIALVTEIYQITEKFPSRETYGLTSQVRRAAVSVPSNIAEGHVREHIKEYLNHLSMAQASLAEVETQIEIEIRLKHIATDQAKALLERSASLARQLHALRKALKGPRDDN
jgi:four helix bundle protein